jgi:hypothetical protein
MHQDMTETERRRSGVDDEGGRDGRLQHVATEIALA